MAKTFETIKTTCGAPPVPSFHVQGVFMSTGSRFTDPRIPVRAAQGASAFFGGFFLGTRVVSTRSSRAQDDV